MKKINPTVVVVAIIIAITVLAGLYMTRPAPNQPVTGLESAAETAQKTESLPPATETSPDPGEPIVEPGSPEAVEPVACTMDAKQCPDGSYVGRIAPDCEFAPCPPPEEEANAPVACPKDVKQCPDGSYVGRVAPDCEFETCPINNPDLQLQMQP